MGPLWTAFKALPVLTQGLIALALLAALSLAAWRITATAKDWYDGVGQAGYGRCVADQNAAAALAEDRNRENILKTEKESDDKIEKYDALEGVDAPAGPFTSAALDGMQ